MYPSLSMYLLMLHSLPMCRDRPRMKVLLPCYLDMNLDYNQVVISLDKNLATFCHICRYSRQLFFHQPILSLTGPFMALKPPTVLDCRTVLCAPRADSFQIVQNRLVLVSKSHLLVVRKHGERSS